ncbi:DUF3899 domain-containing protein [Aciduricibacillus chroicocephali]|uniref:DUF3899 domain-containing protein n=1 Tax=Aciduricibacillus chroicocephali TaxID=3054939 RepID=A0ABY9KU48_9BACI|nr:DUF3899 domain-containing protein [Bacillaceae bacterium 44XB]
MSLKKLVLWIAISQAAVLAACFIFYKGLTLLVYTDVSFMAGILLVLISLFGFVIRGGFFDIVFHSFQSFFGKMEGEERRRLSELMPQSYLYPFITGLVMLFAMAVALYFYY